MRTLYLSGFVLCAMLLLISGCKTACPDTKICLEEDGINNGPLCQQYCEEQICNGPSDVSFAGCCEPTTEFVCPNLAEPGAFENRLECFCMCRSGGGTCDLGVEPGTGGTGGGGTGGTGGSGASAVSCDVCGELGCAEFQDDTFVMADWEDAQLLISGTARHDVSQGTDGQGNPDPYRFVEHIDVGMNSSIWIAHDKTGAVYDASADGRIRSIHYSFDGRALEGSRQASIRPLAKQDGRWFWTDFTTYQLINENELWVTKRWDDASLIPAGHSEELDLSGAQITVGFATGASHTTGVDMVTRNTGVDNWRVVICHE
jgi:hypothetical protein